MKPLKLTMTAFGPYKNSEVVDFTELEQNNLFVISGNTGAGKTTIFDGICFALYGSASGTDREDSKMLRSDFAEDNTHTAIELEFELNGRIYRILRQLGHVKQGNKSKTGEQYEFYEKINGREIPCVDRQMVSEIDKKVEAIIGLTQDQFKQIVMLPQGEFRKLLTSQTENKEAILRRLFKTENYKHINDILKNKKTVIEQNFRQAQQTRDHHIQSIPAALPKREASTLFQVLSEEYYNVNQVVAGLEQEALFYQDKISADQQNYDAAFKNHDKKQGEFHLAQALNERFEELDMKEKQLGELKIQIPDFITKEKVLAEAERASQIEIYEKQANEWRKEEKDKDEALVAANDANKHAEVKLEQSKAIYQQEENKSSEREEVGKNLQRLKDYLPTIKKLDEQKRDLQQLDQKRKTSFESLNQVKAQLTEKSDTVEATYKKINEQDQTVSQLPEKQEKLSKMREQVKVLMDYLKLKSNQTAFERELRKKEEALNKVKAAYNEIEEGWLNNQASFLASHLHDGESCPVCGSIEHPNKALNQDKQVTKEQLDAKKNELDETDKEYRDVLVEHKSNETQLKEKEVDLQNFQIPTQDASDVKDKIVEQGKLLGEEVNYLLKQRDEIKKHKEFYEKTKEEVRQLQLKKEQLEKSYQEQHSLYETSKAVYDDRLKNIPEEVTILTKLEKEISETEKLKLQLEKAWKESQTKLQQAREDQTKAASNMTHAKKQSEETKAKREKAEKQFAEALVKADFEFEQAYQQAKMLSAEQEKLKEAIRVFNEQLAMKKQQVKELENVLKDKTRVDLSKLKEKLAESKQVYELAYNTLNLSKQYQQESASLRTNITVANDKVIEREKKLATITDLYDVLRGQNNQKISFERYLQIEYLERIIEAANGRLTRLSNGQFYLIRSDRQESHGRQSGLALDVYDEYTGQTRDVKTLSGGEKFNASLCLALGMSDVIQSFQGNISINTMFIDEGFGSLDEESLNKSIETLIDLQKSGRMIGVISHVQELKTMFPAILDVLKTKEGYSKTKFVIK
ncbi:AAA family ATPase [Virgibacillus sp. DJP39]|uniref:AAA family ATPase n=1 Tax=Virgibacillus sp. DJP39 TaxID=3409790 RepID=UPI003BB7CA75